MLRKATGSYRTYSVPGKTAVLVSEFAVEELPSAELQVLDSGVCSERPAVVQNTLMMIFYCIIIYIERSILRYYNNKITSLPLTE